MRVLGPRHLVWAKYDTFGVPDKPNFKAEFTVTFTGNKMDRTLPVE